jgi:hypothetical protein
MALEAKQADLEARISDQCIALAEAGGAELAEVKKNRIATFRAVIAPFFPNEKALEQWLPYWWKETKGWGEITNVERQFYGLSRHHAEVEWHQRLARIRAITVPAE